jgi:hypothetical protein
MGLCNVLGSFYMGLLYATTDMIQQMPTPSYVQVAYLNVAYVLYTS